jgi:hypothetical protein
MSAVLTKTQIWGAPVALGVVSLVGLLSALLADGPWDALSWLALAAPVVVSAWGLWRPRQPVGEKRAPPRETRAQGL